mgnify:CR=1
MVGPNFNGTAARLARVVGPVQRSPAGAANGARLCGKGMVDAQQQRKELRVVQERMAHCDGL